MRRRPISGPNPVRSSGYPIRRTCQACENFSRGQCKICCWPWYSSLWTQVVSHIFVIAFAVNREPLELDGFRYSNNALLLKDRIRASLSGEHPLLRLVPLEVGSGLWRNKCRNFDVVSLSYRMNDERIHRVRGLSPAGQLSKSHG